MDDPGDEEHALTITATIEYYEITADGNLIHQPPLSTSITLSVKPDSQFDDQTVSEGEYISASMKPEYVDDDFNLYLYDPNGTLRDSSELGAGQTETVSTTADIEGYWKLNVDPTHDNGFYRLKINIYISSGECPILYVWNGTDQVSEGLLSIHNSDGIDIVYNHTLVPQSENGAYLLRLVEHPQTISHIDQVKLYAIIEEKTLNGKKLIELPLIYAWHSEYGNVLSQLLLSDYWKTEILGRRLE